MALPALFTRRLALFPWTEQDIDPLHLLWTGAEVRRFLWNDQIISREQTEKTVRACILAAERRGIGQWTIHEGDSAVLSGFCGFRLSEDTGEAELLYGLTPARWRHGFATEAAEEALRYAFDGDLIAYVAARTNERNTTSEAVMRRLGMAFDGRIECENGPVVCYSLTRHAFARRRETQCGVRGISCP